jgi:hypothetical protein
MIEGWRIPLLLSAVLVVVGDVIWRRIGDSPTFVEVKKTGNVDKYPVPTVLRTYSMRALLIGGAVLCVGVTIYMMAVFGLTYTVTTRSSGLLTRVQELVCGRWWDLVL